MVLRHAGKSMIVSHTRITDALEANDLERSREALLDEIDATHDLVLDGVMQEESAFWHLNEYNKSVHKQSKETV